MTSSRTKQESKSTPVAGPSKRRPHKKSRNHPYANKSRPSTDEDVLPGVQKLKSAIRQTKRLLAKDNLAADVRVGTERRLKALEADLARAELLRKERHYATKYHKVKFFERQKIFRKINQTKRSMASSQEKEKKKLESILADLRVDLNYILHFPKTEKYVSLFPPELRHSGSTAAPVAASSDDNEDRLKVREAIRLRMKSGELSNEPENELGKLGQYDQRPTLGRRAADSAESSSIKATRVVAGDTAGDEFFGDDEEDTEQSEAFDS